MNPTVVLLESPVVDKAIYETPLVKAMTDRFVSEPMLVNQVVTGGCFWPPEDAIDDLAARAADKAYELEQMRAEGDFVPALQIETMRAAEAALVILSADARQRQREIDWANEDRPTRRAM